MELDELKQTWTENARKLDRILNLNLQALKTAQLDKTKSALGRFKAFRWFEMIVGILLLIPLGSFIADRISVPTLAIPGFIVFASVLFPVVIGNIRQLILLGRISYADPVTTIQRKLEEIKLHFLRSFRLPVLMLPLYMAYIVVGLNLFGLDVLAHSNAAFLWANLAVSLIFIAPAVWILRNLSFKNVDNPVIRALVHGSGGKQMIAALEFLNALQEFEDEERNGAAKE